MKQLTCEICGHSFERQKFKQTCSQACMRKLQSQRAKKRLQDPVQREQNKQQLNRADVRSRALEARNKQRSDHNYINPAKGQKRTAEQRARISVGHIGQHKGLTWEQRFGKDGAERHRQASSAFMCRLNERLLNERTSDLEKRVAQVLCKRGFVQNKRIGHFVVDFVNDETKTIVEVYGDYWHGNPNKFSDDFFIKPLKMTVAEKRVQDAKRQALLKSLGYHVQIIWESDVGEGNGDVPCQEPM